MNKRNELFDKNGIIPPFPNEWILANFARAWKQALFLTLIKPLLNMSFQPNKLKYSTTQPRFDFPVGNPYPQGSL
jgi:hypothetical protein